MVLLHPAFVSLLLALSVTANVINVKREPPQPWESLAGRSQEEIEEFIKRNGNKIVGAQPLPVPMVDDSMKLVHDAKHQYRAPRPGIDTRGPCPGMNTLANHGFYSRTGVDTPQNLIIGSQEGFNMGWDLASFVTIYSHVLFGNVLTNMLSIGEHHPSAGPLLPQYPNAVQNGLATHGDFEGDSSQSRKDAALGDPLAFDEGIFNEFLTACDAYGGVYNSTSASFMRYSRYSHSKATNPDFHFQVPRYMTAYGETTFPLAYWQDGRALKAGKPLTCRSMRIFYEQMKMPKDFWRRDGRFGLFDVGPVVNDMRAVYQLEAGHNEGVGNWIKAPDADQMLLDANGPCAIYKYACHKVTTFLYPNATGILRKALQDNFVHMWTTLSSRGQPDTCSQVFPYEQPC